MGRRPRKNWHGASRRYTMSQRNRMARRRRRVRTLTGWLKWLWREPKVLACLLTTACCLMLLGCAPSVTYRRSHTETLIIDGVMIRDSWEIESRAPLPRMPEDEG